MMTTERKGPSLGDHFGTLHGLCLLHNSNGFLGVLQEVKVDANDIVPLLGHLVCICCFLVAAVSLLGLGVLGVDLGGGDFGQQITHLTPGQREGGSQIYETVAHGV